MLLLINFSVIILRSLEMKETTTVAMPPCFDRWCQKFDDLFRNKSHPREFRNYLGGLLGESERKNLSQIAKNAVEVTYHRLHHCLERRIRAPSLEGTLSR